MTYLPTTDITEFFADNPQLVGLTIEVINYDNGDTTWFVTDAKAQFTMQFLTDADNALIDADDEEAASLILAHAADLF